MPRDWAGFVEECRRQSLVVAATDAADDDLNNFLEGAVADLAGENEA
ncbi:antitoxin MazE-like protein [Bosea sp. R86505]